MTTSEYLNANSAASQRMQELVGNKTQRVSQASKWASLALKVTVFTVAIAAAGYAFAGAKAADINATGLGGPGVNDTDDESVYQRTVRGVADLGVKTMFNAANIAGKFLCPLASDRCASYQ